MMTFRSESLRPELPESSAFPSILGAPLDVAAAGTANKAVDVITLVEEVPPWTTTMVLTTTCVVLLRASDEIGDAGPVLVTGLSEEAVGSVAASVSDAGVDSDTTSEASVGDEVETGSSSVGDVEVDSESDTGSGFLDVAIEVVRGSLSGVEEGSGSSEGVGALDVATTGVALLAEAPVPLGTTCRYRSA